MIGRRLMMTGRGHSGALSGYFISPTGSDTTGNGSISLPWKTIQKWIDSSPTAGDTLYCRGGTYSSPPIGYAGHGFPVLPGTSAAPITICNYPGETPIFSGGIVNEGFIWLADACTYVVIDGLEFEERAATDADLDWGSYQGLIVLGGWADGVTYETTNITIRNCKFRLKADYDARGHAIYISGGCRYITVEDCEIVGAVTGRTTNKSHGLHAYHGDSAAHRPAVKDLLIQRNIFRDWETGCSSLILWDYADHALEALVLHNTFLDNVNPDIRAERHGYITIRDNATDSTTLATFLSDPYDAAYTTQDHNFLSQTFDASYYLLPGNTGIDAASDGTDAGALDT